MRRSTDKQLTMRIAALIFVAAFLLGSCAQETDDGGNFYTAKTISYIVATDPGGIHLDMGRRTKKSLNGARAISFTSRRIAHTNVIIPGRMVKHALWS